MRRSRFSLETRGDIIGKTDRGGMWGTGTCFYPTFVRSILLLPLSLLGITCPSLFFSYWMAWGRQEHRGGFVSSLVFLTLLDASSVPHSLYRFLYPPLVVPLDVEHRPPSSITGKSKGEKREREVRRLLALVFSILYSLFLVLSHFLLVLLGKCGGLVYLVVLSVSLSLKTVILFSAPSLCGGGGWILYVAFLPPSLVEMMEEVKPEAGNWVGIVFVSRAYCGCVSWL